MNLETLVERVDNKILPTGNVSTTSTLSTNPKSFNYRF